MSDDRPDLSAAPLDEVTLRGMRFHTLVGILPHERELPQPLEVDLFAHVTRGIVVDYRQLYDAAARTIAAGPIDYLERAAASIAAAALAVDGVVRVRVAIRKPAVPLPGPLAYAEVAITRDRTS